MGNLPPDENTYYPGQVNVFPAKDDITATRQTTHGDFDRNALFSQAIKEAFRGSMDWKNTPAVQREALDMIALKLSRIVSGKADHKDHWDDIEGYARLGGKACTS